MKTCQYCSTENFSHRTYCKKCGGELYHNDLDKIRKPMVHFIDIALSQLQPEK